MMEKYLVLIEVKCTAPSGYKPRSSTYKGFGMTDDKKDVETLKERAVDLVKKSLSEQNPGIPIKYVASAEIRNNLFFVTKNGGNE